MAIGVGLIKKIVLQLIGGLPLKGAIHVKMTPIIMKAAHQVPGAGILGSILPGNILSAISNITNAISNISELANLAQNLVQNPLGTILNQVTDNLGSLTNTISGLPGGISSDVLNTLNNAVGGLDGTVTDFLQHTDIMSGVADGSAILGVTSLKLLDIKDLSSVSSSFLETNSNDLMGMIGALTNGSDLISNMNNTVGPSGTATGILNQINTLANVNPLDPQITILANQFSSALGNHSTNLTDQINSDLTVQSEHYIKTTTLTTISSYMPDSTDETGNQLMNMVAKPDMLAILNESAAEEAKLNEALT